MAAVETDQAHKREKVLAQILIMEGPNQLLRPLDDLTSRTDTRLQPPILAFRRNLSSAFGCSSLPFLMANQIVVQRRLTQLLAAERIRAQGDNERAWRVANDRLQVELAEKRNEFAEAVVDELHLALADDHFAETAQEIFRQAVVTLWGSLEVFANDALELILNVQPRLAERLLSDETAKKVFDQKHFDISLLKRHHFDLSRSMGTALLGQRETLLDSLPLLKTVVAAAFGNCDTLKCLGDPNLWRLWQQRHLIVHRRGIVDETYIRRSGDTRFKIGAEITLEAKEVEAHFVLIRDTGMALANDCISALTDRLVSPLGIEPKTL